MIDTLKETFARTKQDLITTIDKMDIGEGASKLQDSTMAHGYDKEKAFLLMSQLDMIKKLIDKLEYPSLTAIAAEVGTSDTALRTLWEEMTGESWSENRRYEVTIREYSATQNLRKKKHPEPQHLK